MIRKLDSVELDVVVGGGVKGNLVVYDNDCSCEVYCNEPLADSCSYQWCGSDDNCDVKCMLATDHEKAGKELRNIGCLAVVGLQVVLCVAITAVRRYC